MRRLEEKGIKDRLRGTYAVQSAAHSSIGYDPVALEAAISSR
jgi:hypothetical protein